MVPLGADENVDHKNSRYTWPSFDTIVCARDRCPEPLWTRGGIELESDPCHAEMIIRAVGVTGPKLSTPMVKERADNAFNEDIDLAKDLALPYRSTTMRAAYLSQDRPDI